MDTRNSQQRAKDTVWNSVAATLAAEAPKLSLPAIESQLRAVQERQLVSNIKVLGADSILVRGNHEDLYEEFATVDHGLPYSHHLSNGTHDTALQLTGFDKNRAMVNPLAFARAARETPYYETIIPAMVDYYETESFIITRGWIPCVADGNGRLAYIGDWREASEQSWRQARWINGMDAVRTVYEDGKTIDCGHWHTSDGHSKFEGKGTEFGEDADFSPCAAKGIIALDACTAHGVAGAIVQPHQLMLRGQLLSDEDVQAASAIFVSGTVNLYLNGHALMEALPDDVITLRLGAVLNLFDDSEFDAPSVSVREEKQYGRTHFQTAQPWVKAAPESLVRAGSCFGARLLSDRGERGGPPPGRRGCRSPSPRP